MNNLDRCSESLWKKWVRNAELKPDQDAIVHWVGGEQPLRWTFSALIRTGENFARMLVEHGIKQGDVCALILRHQHYFYPIYLGVSRLGAIPAVLAYPNSRLHPDKFRQGIEGMAQRSGLDWILTERELEQTIRPSVERPDSTIKGLQFPLEWDCSIVTNAGGLDNHQTKDSDPVLLQHSSGTTGLQKPVLLSHRAVLAHVEAYGAAIQLSETDKIVSWLPLYHDMGLIAAFHLPLAFGIPSVQISPFEWVTVPSLLLEVVSKEGGTISWLPNFALNLMADKIREEDLSGIDLRSWRLVINCSEPVRWESHQKFLERFQPYGLRPNVLSSCYAMAETTFGVTQTLPGRDPVLVEVDRSELARGRTACVQNGAAGRICVSSGRLIEGCEIRIVDKNGIDQGEGIVGEIAIKSTSLFDGYRNYPEKTSEVLRDGWYYSGDYGFKSGDEYFIIGRKKDTIIVAGNNISPEDIEDVVNRVEGIIPGRVVAFGEENDSLGSEQVSVIAETEVVDENKQSTLRMAIIKAGMSIDVSIAKVYLVPPRWLIKSSAGKLSRSANKQRIGKNVS